MPVTNQILNPSFEVDVSNWTISTANTTLTRVTTSARDGGASGKVASTGAASLTIASNQVAATPGQIWSAGAFAQWAVGATPRQCWLVQNFYDAAHGWLSNSVGTGTPDPSSWLQITQLNKPAPSLTAFVGVELYVVGAANGDAALFDAIQLVNAATLPALAAGDSLKTSMNRLAGTTGLDEKAAANVWAGTFGRDLKGALNAKAGTFGLDEKGALNVLAGTFGLGEQDAARRIA